MQSRMWRSRPIWACRDADPGARKAMPARSRRTSPARRSPKEGSLLAGRAPGGAAVAGVRAPRSQPRTFPQGGVLMPPARRYRAGPGSERRPLDRHPAQGLPRERRPQMNPAPAGRADERRARRPLEHRVPLVLRSGGPSLTVRCDRFGSPHSFLPDGRKGLIQRRTLGTGTEGPPHVTEDRASP